MVPQQSIAKLGSNNTENAVIGEWRDNPFDPHLIASNRPLAYMKHVVVKYVENLIGLGRFVVPARHDGECQ